MKIYLASRYSRRDEMKKLAMKLVEMGHVVTSRWLNTEWVNRPDQSSAAPPEYREKHAEIDLSDIRASDLVVNFTEAPGDGSRGGRHVEFGYAYGIGKECVVIGYRENLFHHLSDVDFYETIEQWFETIGMLSLY